MERIHDNYNDMYNKITQFPKNEKELFALKAVIQQHEENIKNNEKSIKCIENFLSLLTKYPFYIRFCFQYAEQNMEVYWSLKNYPYEIKTAVFDGSKASQA